MNNRIESSNRYRLMMTSSNGNVFHVTGPLWGESTGERWIPLTKANAAELWCFLWSASEKILSRQSRCRWFEKPSRSLWYHCNADSTWLIIHVNETNVIMMQLVFNLVRNAIQNISIWLSWKSLCTRKTGQGTGQVTDSVFPLRQLMLAPWP